MFKLPTKNKANSLIIAPVAFIIKLLVNKTEYPMTKEIILKDFSITTPVKIDGVNVWVTQSQLASVFDVSIPAISMSIDELTKDADIDTDSTIKQILIVALDGKKRHITHYSMDVVYALGFKVRKSARAKLLFSATSKIRIFAETTTSRRFSSSFIP